MSSNTNPSKGKKHSHNSSSKKKGKAHHKLHQGTPVPRKISSANNSRNNSEPEPATPSQLSDRETVDVNSSAQTTRAPSPVVNPSPPNVPNPTAVIPVPTAVTTATPPQNIVQPTTVVAQTPQVLVPTPQKTTSPNNNNAQQQTAKSLDLILERLDSVVTRIGEVEHHVIQQVTVVDDLRSSVDNMKKLEKDKALRKAAATPTFTEARRFIPSPDGNLSDCSNPDPSYIEDTIYKNSRTTGGKQLFRGSPSANSNKSKRISILDNLIQSGENTFDNLSNQSSNKSSNVQYTRMIPSFDHIKLNDLTLRAVIKFINDIMDYEFRYKIPINMKAQISEQCFRRLSIKFHGKIDYQDKYKDMDRDELGRLLLDYVKPETQSQFRQILEDIKLKYNSNTITQDEYKYFYEALIEYSLQFLRWYEILSDQTDPKLIPPCHNKDKGLIKIFLSKLPGELGQELYAELYKEHTVLSTDKNINFHTFHELFIQLIERHNAKHISTRYALNMYENVGKLKTKEANKTNTPSNIIHKNSSNDRFKPQYGNKVLHNIYNNQLETNSDHSDADIHSNEEEETYINDNGTSTHQYMEGDIPDLGFPNDSDDNFNNLNAIISNNSSQSQPKV